MWNKLAAGIIRYRLPFIVLIGLITVVMAFYASKVEMSYDFSRTVPPGDPDMVYLNNFKNIKGVVRIVALPRLKMILKDTVNSKFYLTDIFPEKISSQAQLDTLF